MDLYQYYMGVRQNEELTPEQRRGQVAFNYLHEIRPDLSEKICGTDMDPFYVENDLDPRWVKFVSFLKENWNKS